MSGRGISNSILTEGCSLTSTILAQQSSPKKMNTPPSKVPFQNSEDQIREDVQKALNEGLCPCIIKKPSGNKVCFRKPKDGGRCGFHRVTCHKPEPSESKLSEEPAANKPVVTENELEQEVKKAIDENRCPCIVFTRKREKKVCGNKAKANGKCGIHQTKCNPPDVIPKKRKIVIPETPEPQIVEVKVEEVSNKTCPCILTSRKKAGEPLRICGKKVKENGRCGIHQKKCELPPKPAVPEVPSEEPLQENELAEELDALLEEIPVEVKEVKQTEPLKDILAASASFPETKQEWNILRIADEGEIVEQVKKLKTKPMYDLNKYQEVDELIEACLSI